MPNILAGWSLADLLAEKRKVQEELLAGSQLQSSSAGDVSQSRIIQAGAMKRLNLINRALWAIDPDTYPLTDIAPTKSRAVIGRSI